MAFKNIGLSLGIVSLLSTSAVAENISNESLQNEIQALSKQLSTLESKTSKLASVLNKKSPEFILGNNTGPNFKITAQDNSDMYVKIGTRIQSTFENRNINYVDATKKDERYNDAYLRRTRFEITTGFDKIREYLLHKFGRTGGG